jgi:hypothetical protein
LAQKQYNVPLGGKKTDVVATAGSSISTSAVQLTIDDANCTSKEAALEAIEAIEQAIVEGTWPPT